MGVEELVRDQNHVLVFGKRFCSVNCEYNGFFSKRVCIVYFRRYESVHGCDQLVASPRPSRLASL